MNPQIASKLMSTVPEMQEFVAYIKAQVKQLDSTSGIEMDSPIDIAVEVKGRKRAIEVLVGILTPLIDIQDVTGVDKAEYVV